MTLRDLINSDATLVSLLSQGKDSEVISALNKKDQRGVVPISELKRMAYDIGLIGKMEVVAATPPTADVNSQNLYGLCKTVLGMIRDLPDVNVDNPNFQTGLSTFVAIGFIDSPTKDQIIALGNNRQSRSMLNLGHEIDMKDIRQL